MQTFREFIDAQRAEGLTKMRNDTMFLCGQCRKMAHAAVQIEDRNRCTMCGGPVMLIGHENGRRLLASVARDGMTEEPRRVVQGFGGQGRAIVAREVNRFPDILG